MFPFYVLPLCLIDKNTLCCPLYGCLYVTLPQLLSATKTALHRASQYLEQLCYAEGSLACSLTDTGHSGHQDKDAAQKPWVDTSPKSPQQSFCWTSHWASRVHEAHGKCPERVQENNMKKKEIYLWETKGMKSSMKNRNCILLQHSDCLV